MYRLTTYIHHLEPTPPPPPRQTHLHLSEELALLLIDDLTDDAVVPAGDPPATEGPEAAVVNGVVADLGPTASGSAPACSSSLITCFFVGG